MSAQKEAFARGANDAALAQEAGRDLGKAVRLIRPSALIGAAAQGGAFSKDVVRAVKQVGL
jgi:malic enzyme